MSLCRYNTSRPCENHGTSSRTCLDCVLDQIGSEIEQLPTSTCTATCRIYVDADHFKENVFKIIDKYKGRKV